MPTHRAPGSRLPPLLWGALLALLVVLAILVLIINAAESVAPLPTRTIYVPYSGPTPTVTISYLIVVTATPGVGGY